MTHAFREKTPLLLILLTSAAMACSSPSRSRTDASTSAPGTGGSAGGSAGGSPGTGGAGGEGEPLDAANRPDMRPLSQVDAPPPPANPPPIAMINTRACQYFKMGPYVPVTGVANFSYTAPAITSAAQASRVQVPRQGSYAYVSFTPPAAGEYVIFVSAQPPITVYSLEGMILPDKSLATAIPECTEVKIRQSFYLQAQAHVIRLGQYTVPTVDVVVLPAPPP